MKPNKPTKALIDLDLWCYDIPYAAESGLEEGESPSLDYCIMAAEARFERIMEVLGCTEHKGFLTGKGNFREEIATIKPYKGNRSGKPKLYQVMKDWLIWRFNAEAVDGMEADDMLSIIQTEEGDNTVIISRDKDLRITKGWHYGYACGKQPEFPLTYIDELGYLDKSSKGKVKGGGLSFFYFQMLLGDSTDNIQGVPKWGEKKAYDLLSQYQDNDDTMFFKVLEIYKEVYKESYKEAFLENGDLLWMVNQLNEQGKPVLWSTLPSTLERVKEYGQQQ